jgi:hypothetical protein
LVPPRERRDEVEKQKRGDARRPPIIVVRRVQFHQVEVANARITPKRVVMGDKVTIAFDVTNTSHKAQRLLVDFCIHYVKASGKTSAKVFKLKVLDLAPRETVRLSKTVSTAEMTTRKHHAGKHRVDVLLNGQPQALGVFELSVAK